MDPVTDQFYHTVFIICCCTDHSRFSVSHRIHSIIKMGYMNCPLLHSLCSTVIICCCMSNRNNCFIMQFPDKFFCTFHIRSKSYQFDQSTCRFIALSEKFNVRFADISLYMCTLFCRIKEGSFHIDTNNTGTGLILIYILCRLKDFQKFFFGKSHGCGTVRSYSL